MDRAALKARIEALIDACAKGEARDAERDALLDDLAHYQAAHVPAYANLVRARASSTGGTLPALPTDVFRFAHVASFDAARTVRRFVSSGTTHEERSQHLFCDVSLYERAARVAARNALFPDLERMPLVLLAPSEARAPHSSLSFMLTRFGAWFGDGDTCLAFERDTLDLAQLTERLRAAERSGTPIAVLGTSFAFVHALDGLGDTRFALPPRSRLMLTGGYKGRSREVAPEALRQALERRFGVPESFMVDEYGMTELSSQMYSANLREAALGRPVSPRHLWTPGWVRVRLVDGDGLADVPADGPGLVRIDDAANLDSVSAIQTADIGARVAGGFVVRGRAQGASARGCSLSVDQALEKAR